MTRNAFIKEQLKELAVQAADKLVEKYGFKVLIIAGPNDIANAEVMLSGMRERAVNLAGRTSVSELASVLKRCALFISNDSGPVHIASAVGTPVISIFGRAQKGLGPRRWGPLGEKDKLLHKDVGCIRCLAHNCTRQFTCLKAITVEDVKEKRLKNELLVDSRLSLFALQYYPLLRKAF